MKIFINLTFLCLISHQLLWLPEKNWFQWCLLKKMEYQKFTSFFQNFHQILVFEYSEPPQTWKNPRKWLKNSFSSGHRFYLGCCKIWANNFGLAFLQYLILQTGSDFFNCDSSKELCSMITFQNISTPQSERWPLVTSQYLVLILPLFPE